MSEYFDVDITFSDGAGLEEGEMRLQKALAHAGVASRRASETLISRGRVKVNGETVYELGTRVKIAEDEIRVDGVVVQLDVQKRYFVFNKPTGVLSTMADDRGRPDLQQYVKHIAERVVNVGRLDQDTSGLLILTNDGELANKLAHPKYGVQKTYVAKVLGRVTPQVIRTLKEGIELEDGFIQADAAKILTAGSSKTHTLVEITLHSGRNRIVRRLLAKVGHPVAELVRRQFGPLNLGTLKEGEVRELSAAERGALLTAATDGKENRKKVSAGRPGDGAGAKGMRGVAAKGNPHGRRKQAAASPRAVTSKKEATYKKEAVAKKKGKRG